MDAPFESPGRHRRRGDEGRRREGSGCGVRGRRPDLRRLQQLPREIRSLHLASEMIRTSVRTLLTVGGVLAVSAPLAAHPMTGSNATFVQSIQGPAIAPFLYLGAK